MPPPWGVFFSQTGESILFLVKPVGKERLWISEVYPRPNFYGTPWVVEAERRIGI